MRSRQQDKYGRELTIFKNFKASKNASKIKTNDIDDHVKAFLDKGGAIKKIPIGASGMTEQLNSAVYLRLYPKKLSD
jgi:hypothetical protein|tara:strand:+ start:339 stop:569 length:231 start_codon:yes stop_codon:yes gene_type:complete